MVTAEEWVAMDTEEVNTGNTNKKMSRHERRLRDLYRHYWEPDKRHLGE